MVIDYEQFVAVDIRLGRVVRVHDFPEARKPAYVLHIDFGSLGIKKSTAQITDHYAPEDLEGRLVMAVVNMPPRQVGPHRSEVLVLGVDDGAGIVLVAPDRDAPLGARLH